MQLLISVSQLDDHPSFRFPFSVQSEFFPVRHRDEDDSLCILDHLLVSTHIVPFDYMLLSTLLRKFVTTFAAIRSRSLQKASPFFSYLHDQIISIQTLLDAVSFQLFGSP